MTDHPIPADLLDVLAHALGGWCGDCGPRDLDCETCKRSARSSAEEILHALASWADGHLIDPDGWRRWLELQPGTEPAVCRESDGLASRLDRLHVIGNGVVSLAAAHAYRTLKARMEVTS